MFRSRGETSTAKKLDLTLLKQKLTSNDIKSEQMNLFSNAGNIRDAYIPVKQMKDRLTELGREHIIKCKLVYIRLEKAGKLSQYFAARIGKLIGANIYGLIHPCILIGNNLMHWFDDSLVHFTEFKTGRPFLALDIGTLDLTKAEDVLKVDDVCALVVKYNTENKYDRVKCNCHHFTQDVQETLGMKKQFQGQLGKFIKGLITGVDPEKEFVNPFTKEKIVFESHQQLDDYVVEMLKKNPELQSEEQYYNDWALLKAFDRGFYMGKFGEEKKRPVDRVQATIDACRPGFCCPFNNPYEGTLVSMKDDDEY